MSKKRTIKSVEAYQVFTKREHPGVEAVVRTEGGILAKAICTAGLSVGTFEVPFRYDGGTKWNGKGVTQAAANVKELIAPHLIGMDVADQCAVDRTMLDIAKNHKMEIGGNAIAAVSAAVLKAGAQALDIPLYRHIGGTSARTLPVPGIPAVSGNLRYGGGVTTPCGKPSITFMCYDFSSFREASYAGWEVYSKWKDVMAQKGLETHVDPFRMFNIPAGYFESDEEIFELMADTIVKSGYMDRIGIQIDCAADTYYDDKDQKYYGLLTRDPKDKYELMDLYKKLIKEFPIVIIEDPFEETDYASHAELTRSVDIQVVGDDLFTTNKERLAYGVKIGAANTVLLKVNQIGSITESLEMVRFAYDHGYGVMPCSSRGEGETIADYSVGINAASIREAAIDETGNRFLEIERELGPNAIFAGRKGLKGNRFQN
ncbi:MAG: hypothetical protein LLF89_02450 [Spirochaetaceae bacterium]|nr:hypothetical protein [Spirochaetaceae bacterium]